MKTRNDYVSNSSSCSFIIYVKTDVERSLISELEAKKIVCIDTNLEFYGLPSYSADWIRLDFGDDTLETIDEFYSWTAEFERLGSECYVDSLAHCSFGNNLKEHEDKK